MVVAKNNASAEMALLRRGVFLVSTFTAHCIDHLIPRHTNNYVPHMLHKRALSLFSILLIAVKISSLALVTIGPVLPAYSEAITLDNIFNLTNDSRQSFAINTLRYSKVLEKAAQAKAEDMLANGYFAHNSPQGKTPWEFVRAAGYNYITAGENLAVDFTEAEDVNTAWMNSPGHRANILNKNFEEIGIGIASGSYKGHEAIFVVQMFGTPLAQPIVNKDEPTVVEQPSVVPAQTTPVERVVTSNSIAPEVAPSKVVSLESESAPVAVQVDAGKLTPTNPEEIAILDTLVHATPDEVVVYVTTTANAAKVIARFGNEAVQLDPKSNTSWVGRVHFKQLVGNKTLTIKAEDITGKLVQEVAASFSNSFGENYSVGDVQKQRPINFYGFHIYPDQLEYKFYLLFIAALCGSLILAIGIKRHIQHISMIANSAFVVVLATLLWYV